MNQDMLRLPPTVPTRLAIYLCAGSFLLGLILSLPTLTLVFYEPTRAIGSVLENAFNLVRVAGSTAIMLLAAYVSTWRIPVLQRFGIGRPNIPQFILDTQHPWLEQHRAALSHIDAYDLLCNASSPLRQQPGVPEVPDNLFCKLVVDNNRWGVTRLGWTNAVARLEEIRSCPAALQLAKHFYVDIYRHTGGRWSTAWEPTLPPTKLPHMFLDVFDQMTSLEKIEWRGPSEANVLRLFKQAAEQSGILLPSVKHLSLAPNCEFFIPLCPNLIKLETNERYTSWSGEEARPSQIFLAILEAASGATHLETFGIRAEWTAELLEAVHASMPNIKTLKLRGSVNGVTPGYGGRWFETYPGEEHDGLKSLLKVLARFKHLSDLRLPRASKLGLGLPDNSGCGNVYMGPGGTRWGRYESERATHYVEKGGAVVLETLTQLQSLSIGGSTACNITEGEPLRWPWTDRMEEYLLEVWPRHPGEDQNGPLFPDYTRSDEDLEDSAELEEEDELERLQEEMEL